MGINGLQSFLKANRATLANEIQLKNTSLVVDSNNLQFYLIERSCVVEKSPNYRSDLYGGNMLSFGKLVREFFEVLNKCGITPILVAGSSSVVRAQKQNDWTESNTNNNILRNLEAAKNLHEYTEIQWGKYLNNVSQISNGQRSAVNHRDRRISIPRVMKSVFSRIIRDLGIEIIRTPHEANGIVAKIANDLDCPVLANDSDFMIHQIKRGFIILNTFYYKNLDDKDFIQCHIYQQEKLIQMFPGLQPDCLVMMNLLMGRDAEEEKKFTKLVELIWSGHYEGVLIAEFITHQRIVSMLDWLSKQTIDSALKLVLESEQEDHEVIKTQLDRMISNYNSSETCDFGAVLETLYAPIGTSNETPVSYFLKLISDFHISGIAMCIIFRSTYHDKIFLEDFSQPSAGLVGIRPTAVAIVLLRTKSYDDLTAEEIELEREEDALQCYFREGETYKSKLVKPLEELEGYGSLNHLSCYSMIKLDKQDRQNILMSTFRFDQPIWDEMVATLSKIIADRDYLHEATICMLLTKYVGQETGMKPKSSFAYALVFILLWYGDRDGLLDNHLLSDANLKRLIGSIRHYSSTYHWSNSHSPSTYRPIIHMIASLQSAYSSYFMLNALLGEVLHVPELDRWFNGKMIFRIVEALKKSHCNLDKFCADMPESFKEVCKSIARQTYCIPML